MNKIISFILALILCVAFCGCSNDTESSIPSTSSKEKSSVSSVETTTTDVTVSVDTVISSDISSVVSSENSEGTVSADTEITENSQSIMVTTDKNAMEFVFSSGAGGWSTSLKVNPDLSFSGSFLDSDMGDSGTENPNGTAYVCEFTGRFKNAVKANDYTYTLTLDSISYKHTVGKNWIENGIEYFAQEPYGMTGGVDFVLYTPNTPFSELPQELLDWWSPYISAEKQGKTTLPCYAVYNVFAKCAFFSSHTYA